jgi:hypothetical protein
MCSIAAGNGWRCCKSCGSRRLHQLDVIIWEYAWSPDKKENGMMEPNLGDTVFVYKEFQMLNNEIKTNNINLKKKYGAETAEQ